MSGLKESLKKPLNDLISLPVATWNSIFKRYKLSDFLPWAFWDEDEEIYINNDNTYGAVIECIPRIRVGASTIETIEAMLQKLPPNTYLQFMLYGSPNIIPIVEKYRNNHLVRDEELLAELINETANMYLKKTKEPITKSFNTTLKDYRLIISIKSESKDEITDYKLSLLSTLSASSFFPIELKPNKLKKLLWEIFNINHDLYKIPEYDENMPLNRQILASNTEFIVRDSHIQVDGKTWISLVPQSLSKYASLLDFAEKLGDFKIRNPEIAQFKDNFIVTTSIRRLPKKVMDKVKLNHQTIATQRWDKRIFKKFAKAQEESNEILNRIDAKEPLFAMDLNVLVAGNSYEDAKAKAQIVQDFWDRGGVNKKIHLEEALGIHHLNFLASLPMGINYEYVFEVTKKYRSMFLKNAAMYAPVEADFKGNGDNLLMITRRSQLAGYDLFKSNASFNGYVVATSGAGKSVFLQTIAINSYARGDRAFVLDYDNSFRGLCEAIDAQYITLDPNKPISFNPFSEINSLDDVDEEDLVYLTDFIYMLGSNKNELRALEEEKLIKTRIHEILKELISQYGNKLEITHIRNRLRQEQDKRFQDFSIQLGAYCRGGNFGKFFEGKNEFNINKEFIAVEFKNIGEIPDLRDPIIMILIYHINQLMYSKADTRSNRIQIILDEAHRFLGKNARMDDFIEQAYRRARKYGGSVIIATQGFDDIYDPKGGLSRAGKVIINNSPWKFFLKQTDTSTNLLINSGVFSFDEVDKKVIRSIHTLKGEYSEIFMITPEEFKLPNRLIMNKFFYYLTTTDKEERNKIMQYVNQGYSYVEAIKALLENGG